MEPTAQVVNQSRKGFPNFLFFLPLLFLAILLGMGGYYLGLTQGVKTKQPSQIQPEERSLITEEELPIGLSLLKNPIINQWSGTVKGRLTAKDEDSITIEDEKGNRIVILIRPLPSGDMPGVSLVKEGIYLTLIDLLDIPLNADVQSEFVVLKEGNKSTLVGVDFTYFEKSQE